MEDKVIKSIAASLSMEEPAIRQNLTASLTTMPNVTNISMIETVLNLEVAFGIEIPDEDTEALVSVNDFISYIKDNAPGA